VDLLYAETSGNPDGTPIVLLHGFTQTGRLWGEFGRILGRTHRLVLVDLPGHGGSSAVAVDLVEGAELVAETARVALGGDDLPFDLLGYSLGSRYALHVALGSPGQVARLVLIGATGGMDDPAAAAERRARDEQLARGLETSGDLGAFLRRWLQAPMFAGLADSASGVAERLRNTPEGLASSLRLAGTGTQSPLWGRLGSVESPSLVLAGAADPRFSAHAARLARTLPAAVHSLVPGAGHAAHLHQPAVTARLVTSWLAATQPA